MDAGYLSALHEGLTNLSLGREFLIPGAGTLIAMTASFLPGIGMASLSTILILWTINWQPESVLLLFGALTGGATFMGSITGILFNIPGNSSAAAVLLDPACSIAQRFTHRNSCGGHCFCDWISFRGAGSDGSDADHAGVHPRVQAAGAFCWYLGFVDYCGYPNSSTSTHAQGDRCHHDRPRSPAMVCTDPVPAAPRWTSELSIWDGWAVGYRGPRGIFHLFRTNFMAKGEL